jgi:hypothetical protein
MSDLQEQVLNDLAKSMEQSVDFVVLCDVLKGFGWTVLEVDYDPDAGQGWNTVKNWTDENFVEDHREHRGTWLIENSQDATMFALRWKVRR